MKYGFIIDNRKCIGCHACTTACKSEHDVPLGVFRTWVKQVEKGKFPNTRRVFSVLRCNHCTDAPCVEICPVEALFIRPDGIVDFDKRRCIGCKSCMQACPYDALYIDPDTHTAAKCNYCAHRIDLGLEPACVVVCPEHAIISGDMDDPTSEISIMLARHQTTVRKPEKSTKPNLFYIDGDEFSLSPLAAEIPEGNLWSAQARGVGHYAKYTERLAWSGEDVVQALLEKSTAVEVPSNGELAPVRNIEVLTGQPGKRVYSIPDKGIMWGWEVPAYVTTKAISSGAYLLGAALFISQEAQGGSLLQWSAGISLVFLLLTTALLIKDLDQPKRFLYVLLRPQWRSWLVRGGYALTFFGGLLTLQLVATWLGWSDLTLWLTAGGVVLAVIVAIYTAFLFAQARGRDFWQSPMLPVHMLVHSAVGGGAALALVENAQILNLNGIPAQVLAAALVANLIVVGIELIMPHPTTDAKAVVNMILRGRYRRSFWAAVVLGNILPWVGLFWFGSEPIITTLACAFALWGIYQLEKIWVEAPQRIPLA
ncbi:MAG: polysulfide reductase NrfD [Saprospiraceae bacterium]|nr:polysulfide reductase NrfD [Saprospiraceae bacterium]MDW8483381.1 4Fe-4S dicluster domain-containing protein [Saprospiraceae bacterium]